MIPLPSTLAPLVDKLGRIVRPWNSYLQQFTQAPPSIMDLTVGASPFIYEAREPGNLAITDGTISTINLTRGNITIVFGGGTNKTIPVSINDVVSLAYSVLPTIRFIPLYGQVQA